MRNFLVLFVFLLVLHFSVTAQSGRVISTDLSTENGASSEINAAKLYQEASNYSRLKFAGFEDVSKVS